jgi:hypothetical protein
VTITPVASPAFGDLFHLITAQSMHISLLRIAVTLSLVVAADLATGESAADSNFFERRIRPVLVEHCYECHSEQTGEQQGGLLLDRQSGWLEGGDTNKAVIPGEPDSSLLIAAVRYQQEELQMPPDEQLSSDLIKLLESWVKRGAPGPADDMGETEFSRLGDQPQLFSQAENHWAFQPLRVVQPAESTHAAWNKHPVDQFIFAALDRDELTPSNLADPRTLARRLYSDLTGLPATFEQLEQFVADAEVDQQRATARLIERLIDSPAFGQHLARMWLDVARYADTDSAYRPDTKTPHYFPFAFTYRDYVIDAFNSDKPIDQFIKEQIAADLMGIEPDAAEIAALGFLAAGPYANRSQAEALDDWIDITTRGLMGVTAACARCHDHKFEPIPTADYYALRGVFAAVTRIHPLDEKLQPELKGYIPSEADRLDFEQQRAAIDDKIEKAAGKKSGGNNRSVSKKIRETELAELLLFHPGAPARAMRVADRKSPPESFIFVRGDATARGDRVPRRFLKVIDPDQAPFPDDASGRRELAEKIASADNPLTARVFVNRIWGQLIGSHIVATPSDFGLQGARPTHRDLLDWLTDDFVRSGWSVKRLVRTIVATQTYQQSSQHRDSAFAADPENKLLWRANRKHLTIEAIRDAMLAVSGQLDHRYCGRAERLWGDDYTRRRAIYGFINRFNLDPTLRAFDFPAPLQTQPARGESIVAPQALFTLNSPFVIDQAKALTESRRFAGCDSDQQRITHLFKTILGRQPAAAEASRAVKLVESQDRFTRTGNRSSRSFEKSPWPLMAQALMMSNEFQYVD